MSETARTYILDIEAFLNERDSMYRFIRNLGAQSTVIGGSSLPELERDKAEKLEENRLMGMQADESFRMATRVLHELTGTEDIDEVRRKLIVVKVALNLVMESTVALEELRVLLTMNPNSPELIAQEKVASEDLENSKAFLITQIPATYKV